MSAEKARGASGFKTLNLNRAAYESWLNTFVAPALTGSRGRKRNFLSQHAGQRHHLADPPFVLLPPGIGAQHHPVAGDLHVLVVIGPEHEHDDIGR